MNRPADKSAPRSEPEPAGEEIPRASSPFENQPLCGWYPGHMLKTDRSLGDFLRIVDLVVEIRDARAPAATANPAFDKRIAHKPRFILLSKADLADPEATRAWLQALRTNHQTAQAADLRNPAAIRALPKRWRRLVRGSRNADKPAKFAVARPLRIMIAGIPNVGKSTLVNRLASGRRAAVGPRPGVTRHHQWVPLADGMELLDTPGVLWPRIRDKTHELTLALLGAIPDDLIGADLLVEYLCYVLHRCGTAVRWDRHGLDRPPAGSREWLETVARRRGMLAPGGVPDPERAAPLVLKDFREGRLGRFTFETPGAPGSR